MSFYVRCVDIKGCGWWTSSEGDVRGCPKCTKQVEKAWVEDDLPKGFRAKTAADILSRLLSAPTTLVDGKPFNADVDLPELAEVAVNAADALIVALSRPPNEAVVNRVVKGGEVVKEVVKDPS